MQFPTTLVEFQDQFPDEAHYWAPLRRARWPRGFICPRCRGRGSAFRTALFSFPKPSIVLATRFRKRTLSRVSGEIIAVRPRLRR